MLNNNCIKSEPISDVDDYSAVIKDDADVKIPIKPEPKIKSDSDTDSDSDSDTDSNYSCTPFWDSNWKTELDVPVHDEITKRFPTRFNSDVSSCVLINNNQFHVSSKACGQDIEIVPDSERVTLPFLMAGEYVALLSKREIELENGLPTTLSEEQIDSCDCDFRKIAKLELQEKRIPVAILREIALNRYEMWHIEEMTICNDNSTSTEY